MAKKKLITQRHHLIYAVSEHGQKEVVGRIYKGEHFCLNNITKRTNISSFFIKCLKAWIILNEDNAIDLDEFEELEKERALLKEFESRR